MRLSPDRHRHGSGLVVGADRSNADPPATSGYLLPPKAIVDILDAPPPPTIGAQPNAGHAGAASNAPACRRSPSSRSRCSARRPPHQSADQRPASRAAVARHHAEVDRRRQREQGHASAKSRDSWIGFSPDGKRFAFTQQRDNGIELWVGETATGQAKAVTPAQLNASLGTPCEWVGDGASLLCAFVSPSRGAAPATPAVPPGPNIQENRGGIAPVRTYQDLLASAHDEALFDYYATSQLAFVDATSGQRTAVGRPAVFETSALSPDGQLHPRQPREAAVFVARALHELPVDRRSLGPQGPA